MLRIVKNGKFQGIFVVRTKKYHSKTNIILATDMDHAGRNFLRSKVFFAARNKAIKPVTTREKKKKKQTHNQLTKKPLNLATNTNPLHRIGDTIILFYST